MAMTPYIAADHRVVGKDPRQAQDWRGSFIEIAGGKRFSPSRRMGSVVAALITRIV